MFCFKIKKKDKKPKTVLMLKKTFLINKNNLHSTFSLLKYKYVFYYIFQQTWLARISINKPLV